VPSGNLKWIVEVSPATESDSRETLVIRRIIFIMILDVKKHTSQLLRRRDAAGWT
jgi:hypothetical protein